MSQFLLELSKNKRLLKYPNNNILKMIAFPMEKEAFLARTSALEPGRSLPPLISIGIQSDLRQVCKASGIDPLVGICL